MAKAMTDIGGTDSSALIEYLEGGTKFDLMKNRQGYFNPSNHQLLQEVYAITALPESETENEWDIFTTSGPVIGPEEPLEALIKDAVGGTCTFEA